MGHKMCFSHAGGDARICCPDHRGKVERLVVNILEGIGVGDLLLIGDIAADAGEEDPAHGSGRGVLDDDTIVIAVAQSLGVVGAVPIIAYQTAMLRVPTACAGGWYDHCLVIVARIGDRCRFPVTADQTIPGLDTVFGASRTLQNIPFVKAVPQGVQCLETLGHAAAGTLQPDHTALVTGGLLPHFHEFVDAIRPNGNRKKQA